MLRSFGFSRLVIAALAFAVLNVSADPSDPAAQSSLLPSPAESGIPEKITKRDVRRIRREFVEQLDREGDALRREQRKIRKAGAADRKLRKREWDQAEKAARRKFFEENQKGPERRKYVQEFNERRKAFYALLKNEEKLENEALDARRKSLRESQRTRLSAVEAYLKRFERPPSVVLVSQEG